MPPQHFNSHTTAYDAANEFRSQISAKVVLITGCSPNGLGAETARVVAHFGAKLVIMAGRDEAKLKQTQQDILKETPEAKLRLLLIDLASLASVRAAAKEVNSYPETIDVLINNAGIMAGPYSLTTDGYESQFATNHLGPFLFTNLIRAHFSSPFSSIRIVNVSSGGHVHSGVRFDDPGFKEGREYDKWKAYGQSKTANMLFSVELTRRWGVEAFSLHPGGIYTNLTRHLTVEDGKNMGYLDKEGKPIQEIKDRERGNWKTIPEGTSTQIVAAFDPQIGGQAGSYLEDAQIANEKAKPWALDKENAAKLWTLSEQMVGETFA
ncbi:NAD(P)-binding protein [Meredithblackwellia eburnea MCA 4105]